MAIDKRFVLLLAALLSAPSANAGPGCTQAGVGQQQVLFHSGFDVVQSWAVVDGKPHEVTMPNGFHLGVSIAPAPREVYLRSGDAVQDEILKIALYDMSTLPPRLLTYSYGNSNSVQGYGPESNAGHLQEIGAKVELLLSHPICVEVDKLPQGS